MASGVGHTGLSFAGIASRIVAVYTAPNMLAQCRWLAVERGVALETVEACAEAMPLPSESFDLVIASCSCPSSPPRPKLNKSTHRHPKHRPRPICVYAVGGVCSTGDRFVDGCDDAAKDVCLPYLEALTGGGRKLVYVSASRPRKPHVL